jgi:hypothetical protein
MTSPLRLFYDRTLNGELFMNPPKRIWVPKHIFLNPLPLCREAEAFCFHLKVQSRTFRFIYRGVLFKRSLNGNTWCIIFWMGNGDLIRIQICSARAIFQHFSKGKIVLKWWLKCQRKSEPTSVWQKDAADEKSMNGFLEREEPLTLERALNDALDQYVVKRGKMKTVIAGYPWFLDWGRDSLIFVRGLVAAGKTEDAKAVLNQFGRFEKDGTLPNMIHGSDAGNRDTSDAALWFFTACGDLLEKGGNNSFLKSKRVGARFARCYFPSVAL